MGVSAWRTGRPSSLSHANMELVDVVNAIDRLSASEAKQLMVQLGVQLRDLVDIEGAYKDGAILKTHFVQKWLDRDLGASWEKLASGLWKIGKHTLAAKIGPPPAAAAESGDSWGTIQADSVHSGSGRPGIVIHH